MDGQLVRCGPEGYAYFLHSQSESHICERESCNRTLGRNERAEHPGSSSGMYAARAPCNEALPDSCRRKVEE